MGQQPLNVLFGEGKRYAVAQDSAGHAVAFDGDVQQDILGDKLVLALAYDLQEAQEAVGNLAQAVWGTPDAAPSLYDDPDRMVALERACQALLPRVRLGDGTAAGGVSPSTLVRSKDNKYAVAVMLDGSARAYRYGEPWRDLDGEPLVVALANELDEVRALAFGLSGTAFSHRPGEEPDAYADMDDLARLEAHVRQALPGLPLRTESSAPSM